MDACALGGNKEQNVSARVSLVAAHYLESKRLCGPSPVVPHFSDSFRGVFRSAPRREDWIGFLRRSGSAFVLLAVAEVSHSLSARVVDCSAGLRAAVSV